MSRNIPCTHLEFISQLSLSELSTKKQGYPCGECDATGPNLWICLHRTCLHIGCSEEYNDHSTKHFHSNDSHCIHMNLSSQRIWCYICEMEVTNQHYRRRSSLISNRSNDGSLPDRYTERYSFDRTDQMGGDSSGGEDTSDVAPRHLGGLVGLHNIANTCYMNAAIQALSNTPPLTGYFLDCGEIIEVPHSMGGLPQANQQRKTGLAKSYYRLIKDMWCVHRRSNGYVVPSGVLNSIRNVHPMFRGYQQHDTQEFLRCFMDQLHEELKEMTPPPPEKIKQDVMARHQQIYKNNSMKTLKTSSSSGRLESDEDRSQCSTPSPSQSEAEYETCDSGSSEQSSQLDDLSKTIKKSVPKKNRYISCSYDIPLNGYSSQVSNSNLAVHQRKQSVKSSGSTSSAYGSLQSTTSNNSTAPSPTPPTILSKSATTSPVLTKKHNTDSAASKPDQLAQNRSIISDVFDGKLLSSVQCYTCARISTREETFQDLSLPIPSKDSVTILHHAAPTSTNVGSNSINLPSSGVICTDALYQATQAGWFGLIWSFFKYLRSYFVGQPVSLYDCMAAFFSADELKGDNMYSCDKCNKLRNGVKYSRVLELPEMLCVHLKRFRHDLSYSSKITSPVEFPMTGLDMSKYLHKECRSQIANYDLTSVICHHGTVGSGHYTSYAKHQSTGKWFEYDDQLVSEVHPDTVKKCEAYVLFYRKCNQHMSGIREHAERLAELSSEQATDIRFYVSRQWLNKFNTFAEPGPIDNWALLCPHGGLTPAKAEVISRLVEPLPQPLWEYLYQQFGGGPVCNQLYECDICKRAAESLLRRQLYEQEAFTKYKDEMTVAVYAISMAWFRQWQLFVSGSSPDAPGRINNSTIAGPIDKGVIRRVWPGSDYAQISSTLWKFFHGIYGGGPEIILRGADDERMVNQKQQQERNVDEHVGISDGGDTGPIDTEDIAIQLPKMEIIDSQEDSNNNNRAASPLINRKQIKSVSFEDKEGLTGDVVNGTDMDSVTSSIESTSTDNSGRKAVHRQNYQNHPATTTSLQIGSKKERHRGSIKTNGFFGAEGKYSTQNTDISDTKYTNQYDSFSIQKSQSYNSPSSPQSQISSSPPSMDYALTNTTKSVNHMTTKSPQHHYHHHKRGGGDTYAKRGFDTKVDEVIPLLHQVSTHLNAMNGDAKESFDYSATTKKESDDGSHKGTSHHNKKGSSVSRKRIKYKTNRKYSTQSVNFVTNHIDEINNFSD